MNLSQEDVLRFYDVFFKLIDYTNEKYQVVPGLAKAAGAEMVDSEAITPVRNKLWENDDVINRIVTDNPLGFSDRDLALVASWKRRIVGRFLVYKYLKRYAVFMSDDKLYGVVGLTSPLDDLFPSFILPRFGDFVLLPFEEKITYDSLIYLSNITFGSGIRRRFSDDYRKMKAANGIITTL